MQRSLLLFIFLFFVNELLASGKEMVLVPAKDGKVKAFYMDKTPVTYSDFEKYVTAGGRKNAYWDYDTYHIAEQPVTGISWLQAVDYCNWRSVSEGWTPVYYPTGEMDYWGFPVYKADKTANGYRLPSSAEFEWAASGGSSSKFPWGDDFSDSLANYDTDHGHKTTEWWRLAPVNSQFKNNFGLYNICGNNWHWCDDWVNDMQRAKKLKGGSWGTVTSFLLELNNESHCSPGNYNYDIGFRCIRYPDANGNPRIDSFYNFLPCIISKNEVRFHDFYSPEFIRRLTEFITDNYPQCINFILKIDEQEIITPYQMAEEICGVCKLYKVNPLFLVGIMVSESGFGTVSFPRWYNNPMAFHWQNKLMKNGTAVYNAKPNITNRKFRKLKDGFEAFCKGIRRELYYRAAMKNLDAFHLVYVGYRAEQWMHTITNVFATVAGIRLEPEYPKEAGSLIYTDWDKIRILIK